MYKKHIDVNEVAEFVKSCSPNTKLYIGCDSERLRVNNVWYADYISVIIVHVNGNNGCKIFGAVDRERDYDQKISRPKMRLMNEVYRASNLYLELSKLVTHDIFVHLDINPNEAHGSSVAVNEAIGYIKGTCNVVPFIKPNAWAASYGADRFKEICSLRKAMA